MMEVTPHLKSVLKNYQHSATKSLQGPGGLSLVVTAGGSGNGSSSKTSPASASSPDLASGGGGAGVANGCGSNASTVSSDEDFLARAAAAAVAAVPPLPIRQLPILTTADTSCSERTETTLEDETISCFVVGGEKRLCLPQVLNSVLRDFTLMAINQQCDRLQIFCSRCTPEQLNVLKSQGILPSSAPSCGLITKTDAERLCSALLHQTGGCGSSSSTPVPGIRIPKGALTFPVYHKCFGKCRGLCVPDLYTSKDARCIECAECKGGFAPRQFVRHVHGSSENRTVHWGFNSDNWRIYTQVSLGEMDREHYLKYLDVMKDQFDGAAPFPPPPPLPPPLHSSDTALKRKQVTVIFFLFSSLVLYHKYDTILHDIDMIKLERLEIPLKKNKMDDMANLPFTMQHLYNPAALDTMYIQYLHDMQSTRHLSAFKPFPSSHPLKDSKPRLGISSRYSSDPPILQHPERVVSLSDSKRFEQSYQPNVALAPPTPKKFRYGKRCEASVEGKDENNVEFREEVHVKEEYPQEHPSVPTDHVQESMAIVKNEVQMTDAEETATTTSSNLVKCVAKRSPEQQSVIDSTVSVVQSTGNLSRYNSEIELSTDTDDSASETSEKQSDLYKIEGCLKDIDVEIRNRVLSLFKNIAKEHENAIQECRLKDNKISELDLKICHLEKRLSEYENSETSKTNGVIGKDSATTNHCAKLPSPDGNEVIDDAALSDDVPKENFDNCEINSSSIKVITNKETVASETLSETNENDVQEQIKQEQEQEPEQKQPEEQNQDQTSEEQQEEQQEQQQVQSVIKSAENLEQKAITPTAPE